MNFQITVTTSGKQYKLDVELKYVTAEIERWEVRAKNHTFLIDCNRPAMVKDKVGHLAWQWNLVAGEFPGYFLIEIQNEIRKTLNGMDKSG